MTTSTIRGRIWRHMAEIRSFADPEPVWIPAGWRWQVDDTDLRATLQDGTEPTWPEALQHANVAVHYERSLDASIYHGFDPRRIARGARQFADLIEKGGDQR